MRDYVDLYAGPRGARIAHVVMRQVGCRGEYVQSGARRKSRTCPSAREHLDSCCGLATTARAPMSPIVQRTSNVILGATG